MSLVGNLFGVLFTFVTGTLFFLFARRILQHSVSVWGVRSTATGELEYEFTIQNLEAVPISAKVIVRLRETDVPSGCASLLEKTATRPPELRVYSGLNRPLFKSSRILEGSPGIRETLIEFNKMDAFDVWSIRLRTPATSVTMELGAGELPGAKRSSRFKSVGLDLAVQSVELGVDKAKTEGPRRLPTAAAGRSIAALGPFIYGVGVWLLTTFHVVSYDAPISFNSIALDVALALSLSAIGIAWYFWVRRPVLPAIQAYRTFWVPNSAMHQAE